MYAVVRSYIQLNNYKIVNPYGIEISLSLMCWDNFENNFIKNNSRIIGCL